MNTTHFLNLVAGNLFHSKSNPGIPATYYIGLSTAAPQINGTGAKEPGSGTGYARVAITFTTPDNGVVHNLDAINFPESTANWGTLTHYAVYDSSSGGQMLFFGPLSSAHTVEANMSLVFKPNALEISVLNTNA